MKKINTVTGKNRQSNAWLPVAFLAVAAVSRWPGLFPPNFSAFYGLAFCAGALFPGAMKWLFPLGTLALTDIALDLYYRSFSPEQFMTYAAFAGLIWLGSRFNPRSSLWKLLGGGIVGSVLFYLATNSAAWLLNPFHNPEYTKDLNGWIEALTRGTGGYPTTLEFFRNTLVSGALFTALFAGSMKLTMQTRTSQEPQPETALEPNVASGWHTKSPLKAALALGNARHHSPHP